MLCGLRAEKGVTLPHLPEELSIKRTTFDIINPIHTAYSIQQADLKKRKRAMAEERRVRYTPGAEEVLFQARRIARGLVVMGTEHCLLAILRQR